MHHTSLIATIVAGLGLASFSVPLSAAPMSVVPGKGPGQFSCGPSKVAPFSQPGAAVLIKHRVRVPKQSLDAVRDELNRKRGQQNAEKAT
jgi:hypothetical protein